MYKDKKFILNWYFIDPFVQYSGNILNPTNEISFAESHLTPLKVQLKQGTFSPSLKLAMPSFKQDNHVEICNYHPYH